MLINVKMWYSCNIFFIQKVHTIVFRNDFQLIRFSKIEFLIINGYGDSFLFYPDEILN